MPNTQWIILENDCEALLIPTAVPMTIPAGTEIQIIQSLGGHITANVHGNLLRIDKAQAESLGLPESLGNTDSPPPYEGPMVAVDEQAVWDQLKTVYDPEIPVNIVDLGLIYKVTVRPEHDQDAQISGNTIEIQMTLTAPGCGMGPVIVDDAKAKVQTIPCVTDINVELVFDPPWDRSMMSEHARLELDLF